MVLNIPGSLFADRSQIEGMSPDSHEISREGDLTQNISAGLGRASINLNHPQTGSLINISDNDDSTSLQWQGDWGVSSAELTTTMVLDIGKFIKPFNTIIALNITTTGIPVMTMKTEYSVDGTNYFQIGLESVGSAAISYDIDHTMIGVRYRFLRFTFTAANPASGSTSTVQIKEVKIIR